MKDLRTWWRKAEEVIAILDGLGWSEYWENTYDDEDENTIDCVMEQLWAKREGLA